MYNVSVIEKADHGSTFSDPLTFCVKTKILNFAKNVKPIASDVMQ